MSFASKLASKWEQIALRYPPGLIEGVGSAAVQLIGFILPALIFMLVDLLYMTKLSSQKIQRPSKQPSKKQILSSLTLVFGNQAYLIASHFLVLRLTRYKISGFRMDPQLPSIFEVAVHCLVGSIIRDILFYYMHRLMHTKFMYRKFHRVHHEFKAPVAVAAIYSHTVDHILVNAMPIYVPMAIQRAHFLTLVIFATVSVFDAAVSHSGYTIFRVPSVESHDIHHEKGNVNFGVLGLMDWLHGTLA